MNFSDNCANIDLIHKQAQPLEGFDMLKTLAKAAAICAAPAYILAPIVPPPIIALLLIVVLAQMLAPRQEKSLSKKYEAGCRAGLSKAGAIIGACLELVGLAFIHLVTRAWRGSLVVLAFIGAVLSIIEQCLKALVRGLFRPTKSNPSRKKSQATRNQNSRPRPGSARGSS